MLRGLPRITSNLPLPCHLVILPSRGGVAGKEGGETRARLLAGVGAKHPVPVLMPQISRVEDSPVGGRLSLFQDRWKFSPWAHSVVSNGLGWKWLNTPPPLKRFFQTETPVLKEYISKMLVKRAIERCKRLRFQARLFDVPKPNGDRRVILDLSYLNKFIKCVSFKMTTVAQVRALLPRGAYTCSIDLSDAYWHVPMAKGVKPYLGFVVGRRSYRFRAMPFGLNIAPWMFTKLTRVILKKLRAKGILVVAYLDDWLVWANSSKGCQEATQEVIQFLEHLGFKINFQKSRLRPERVFK